MFKLFRLSPNVKLNKMPYVKDVLEEAQKLLVAKGFTQEEAAFEARFILSFLLRKRPLDIFTVQEISPAVASRFFELIKRRGDGVPTAYLLGEAEFYGRSFKVGPGVLIPRPETEILVETALEFISPGVGVLELGVGSGCISLSLALEKRDVKVFGVEYSSRALKYALVNRERYHLENRVFFVQGNWLAPLKEKQVFSLIVSNPPYISEEEFSSLEKSVREHEPLEALLAGPKGLNFIAKTLWEASKYLLPGGYVLLEIGYRQKEDVAALAKKAGYRYDFVKDLLGYERVLVVQKLP